MQHDDDSPGTLRILRAVLDKSQTEAARRLKISQSSYSRIESGATRSPKRIAAIMSRLAFAPRDVARDAEAIGKYSPEDILRLQAEIKVAVDNCVELWRSGAMSKDEALSQITPLLQCSKVLLAAVKARVAAKKASA